MKLLFNSMKWPLLGVFLSFFLVYTAQATDINFDNPQSLDKAMQTNPELASVLALKIASLKLDNNQATEAVALLNQKVTSPVWSFWKNTLLAKAASLQGQSSLVQSLLQNIPTEPDPDTSPNQEFFRKLYHEALTLKGDAASKKLAWALFPELDKSQTPPAGLSSIDKVKRLRALTALGKISKAPDFITLGDITSAKLETSVKCKALDDLGSSYRKASLTNDTLSTYNAVINNHCDGENGVKAYYWKAKILSQLKNIDDAIIAYKDFIKKFPDHQYTDDAHHALMTLYKKAGKDHLADQAQKNLLALSKGDMKNRYLFDAGFDDYQKGKFKKAIESFETILKGTSTGDEGHPQALYWKARATEQNSKKETAEAKTMYRDLVARYPFSFYAVLASNKLKQKFSLPVHTSNLGYNTNSPEALEIFATLSSLQKLGAYNEAQDVFDYFIQTYPNVLNKNTLIQKWADVRDYNQSITLAAREMNSSLFAVDLNTASALSWAIYPKPFESEINVGVSLSGLPRGAIAGIMREESLFRPSVLSSAGAVGLMQLMPATATMQSRKIAMTGFNTSLLNNPQDNIKLGATFFADMVKTFKGSYPLAIMAYNAGPGNVRKWLKINGHLPLDEFVEEIPFSETRGYIKRVLRSMQVYGVLFGDEKLKEPFVDFKLPTL